MVRRLSWDISTELTQLYIERSAARAASIIYCRMWEEVQLETILKKHSASPPVDSIPPLCATSCE